MCPILDSENRIRSDQRTGEKWLTSVQSPAPELDGAGFLWVLFFGLFKTFKAYFCLTEITKAVLATNSSLLLDSTFT